MGKIKKSNKVLLIIICFILLITGGFYIYTLDYYKADQNVYEILNSDLVSIEQEGSYYVLAPPNEIDTQVGLIFYPGGKVEAIAYLPLLKQISKTGITCILVEMPMNLAVFDINAADDVYDLVPDVNEWYLCGHSLGGAMASSYVNDNREQLEGLILLGAYPINDSKLSTLAIYGTWDIKLDLTKLEDMDNVIEIVGGNHAYFGNYGEQEGDGTAEISREEQQKQTVKAINEFIFE